MFPRPKPPGYHRMVNPPLLRAVPPGARVVLDVGCGAGAHGTLLKREDPRRVVLGVELDPAAAEEARAVLDRVFVADAEAGDLPLEPGSVDCLLYGDVLEHLRDPEAVLARHRRLLRPGGAAVVSVPNVGHHGVIAALLRGDFPYAPAGVLDATHLRFFTLASFAKLLLDAGYAPEPVSATPGPDPAPPGLVEALGPALAVLGVHPGRAARALAAYQYVFRAYPLPDPPDPAGGGPVTVACCASDDAVLAANLLASPDLGPGSPHEVLVARGCRSAADGLNPTLDRARHRLVVAAHQDVYLPRGWVARAAHEFRRARALLGPVAVAGVYGVAGRGAAAARVGRVVDRERLLWEPAPLPAPADTLDELVLVVDRESGLRFEPALGFHLYAADLCLEARGRGLAAAVIDALCLHNSQTAGLPPSFAASAAALAAKWPGELPVSTPSAFVGPGGRVLDW
jgi:SAM-dependent methyltransferase